MAYQDKKTILPQTAGRVPIAALPVPYRTTDIHKTFFSVIDPKTGQRAYPDNLDCVHCTRADIRKFAEDAKEAGVQYIGLCCGNAPNLTRELAEVYGKDPPASKYRRCQKVWVNLQSCPMDDW